MTDIIDFTKIHGQKKSNDATDVTTRILNCDKNKKCECKYCTYTKSASGMVVEFLMRDMHTFASNRNAEFCSFDIKKILFEALLEVKNIEKEHQGEE